MIVLTEVEKWYGGNHLALHVESVTFNSGEIVGILGDNGSGKTTMLKAIMGIGGIQNGEIWIDSKSVTAQYEKMAFITEEGSFLPHMTPHEYGLFLADFFPLFNKELYDKLMQFFELQPYRKIKTFSRGQKSKLEVCAGFSKSAQYILMDEPFLGKDMFTRRDFLKLMISSLKNDETILITTHLIDDIENVIDRAIILHQGRIKADFYMDDLREEGKDLATIMSEVSEYKADRFKQVLI